MEQLIQTPKASILNTHTQKKKNSKGFVVILVNMYIEMKDDNVIDDRTQNNTVLISNNNNKYTRVIIFSNSTENRCSS